MLYTEFVQKALDAFPEAIVEEEGDGFLKIVTGWKKDPDEPEHVYMPASEEDEVCGICGNYVPEHNWEAHNAEMRADVRYQEEMAMGMGTDDYD